jgi:hypothetical protein
VITMLLTAAFLPRVVVEVGEAWAAGRRFASCHVEALPSV